MRTTTELEAWAEARGITTDTLRAYGCETNEDNDLIFNYRGYTKTRHFGEKRRFTIEPKGKPLALLLPPETEGVKHIAYICEGESDAMRLWQEINAEYPVNETKVFGLPGLSSWRPEMAEDLKFADQVYVVLDNDQDYQARTQGEQAWQAIRRDVPKAKRVLLPDKVKDLCEFFNNFDLSGFIEQINTPNYHYRSLDFTMKPGPTRWLVKNVIAQGDVVLFSGDPGAQKSWLAQSLGKAVCDGDAQWLDFDILRAGNVLYVDEENPEDVVRDRMARLGLSNLSGMRYLLRQGINLDKHANLLLDEVLDFKPALIILDSFVAIHGGSDENSSGSVRALYQNGIFPLARETGATVLVLHHNNKTPSESPFAKVRGSGDIAGAPDSCFTVGRLEGGQVRVVQFKTRRGKLTDPFNCYVKDLSEGGAYMYKVPERF